MDCALPSSFAGERAEERLDFEAQMMIAPRLGFADRGGMRGVEAVYETLLSGGA